MSGSYYGKDFFVNTWQNRPRKSYGDTVLIELQFSLMHECFVQWQSCGWDKSIVLHSEVECFSRTEAEQPPPLDHQLWWQWRGLQPAPSLWFLTSVWWGSYQGQRSTEAAFMKETLLQCLIGMSRFSKSTIRLDFHFFQVTIEFSFWILICGDDRQCIKMDCMTGVQPRNLKCPLVAGCNIGHEPCPLCVSRWCIGK